MSDTPAWAVERAREILALIDVEPSEWCPDCDGQGEIDDGKCGRCGKYGCRTKTCPACNGGKMKPIDRVGIISSALTVPDGHVRLPSGEDVKVIGTLPMTADGCVCGVGGTIYINSIVQKQVVACEVADGRSGWLTSPVCYSTRAAAESARAGGGA